MARIKYKDPDSGQFVELVKKDEYDSFKSALKERLEESEQDLETHKLDYMPHRIQDLKNNKIYKYSLQMSEDGQPQIKFEEVI